MSVYVSFSICINLVQFTWSNTFCQSMKQAHNSSCVSKVLSDIIHSIPIATLAHFPTLNPNWSSPCTFSFQFLTTVFAVHLMRLTVLYSVHFVAFAFFFKAIVVSTESLGHSPVSYMLLISHVTSLRPSSSKQFEYILRSIIVSCSLLILHLLDSCFHFTVQDVKASLIGIYFLLSFDFQVFWLNRLIIPWKYVTGRM
jgi:hypothetical protein